MLALSIALASLLLSPLTLSSPLDERWSDTDQYGGKKLIPSNYTVITNVFIQDSPTFKPTGCNLLNDSFGLIDKSAGRWQNFTNYITQLNQDADEYTTYKVVYMARHGEGYHNQAESTYGAELRCMSKQG